MKGGGGGGGGGQALFGWQQPFLVPCTSQSLPQKHNN